MKWLCVILIVSTSPTVIADPAADAKAFYEKATADFAVGEFAKAADEYQQAYQLRPDAALLYNAAQSYRLAGNNEKALILYRNYVMLYPNQPNIDQVRGQIEKLKEAVRVQERAKTNPPTSTVPVPATTPTPTASASTLPTPTQPQPQLTATAERRRPLTKKAWFWATLGASVLVVAGVTIGVVFGAQPHAPNATVGRVDGN